MEAVWRLPACNAFTKKIKKNIISTLYHRKGHCICILCTILCIYGLVLPLYWPGAAYKYMHPVIVPLHLNTTTHRPSVAQCENERMIKSKIFSFFFILVVCLVVFFALRCVCLSLTLGFFCDVIRALVVQFVEVERVKTRRT